MKRFVEGADRGQSTLFPECLEDWIDEVNPVRVIDALLTSLSWVSAGSIRRPTLVSSFGTFEALCLRLSQPCPIESPARARGRAQHRGDVADKAPRSRSQDDPRFSQGQWLCHPPGLHRVRRALSHDGQSRPTAASSRRSIIKNFTRAKMQRRMAQIEESVARYLHQVDSADRLELSLARATKTTRLKEKIAKLKEEMQRRGEIRGSLRQAGLPLHDQGGRLHLSCR
jgi:hypothetical protein